MIRKLLASVRDYKRDTILAPIFVSIESILEIIIPTLMAFLIDFGISKNDMSYVVRMGLILTVCAIASLVAGVMAGRRAAISSAGFAKNLRHDLFHNVQKFSFSNIDKFSSASLITRLTTDVTNLQNSYQALIRLSFRAPVMIIFALIFSFRIHASLSLIFLAVIPILGFGFFFIIMNVHPIFVRVFKKFDKLNRVVQENLRGIRVVKSFVRDDYEEDKFEDVTKQIYIDFTKAERRLAFNMPLLMLCLYVVMILLAWFGANEIVASGNNAALGLTTGELAGLITYAMQILVSLMMLSFVFVMIIISRASAERVIEVLNEVSDLQDGAAHITEVKNGSISFHNVTFAYHAESAKPVLNNISLEIKSGETVGVVGGTGSSKSSLVQLIPRLYDVSKGQVQVGGVDVKEYNLEALRHQVAMVLQKNVLFSGTIKENLRWGNEHASDAELIHAATLARAHDFIEAFPEQYDYHIEQGGSNVSGGQRQRLCIARALLKKPKILILDDSTSAVDTKTDSLIRQGFKDFIPETTKIIIAQRVASIIEADKIIVLNDGDLIAVGTHDELLLTCEIYRDVYESQHKEVL